MMVHQGHAAVACFDPWSFPCVFLVLSSLDQCHSKADAPVAWVAVAPAAAFEGQTARKQMTVEGQMLGPVALLV